MKKTASSRDQLLDLVAGALAFGCTPIVIRRVINAAGKPTGRWEVDAGPNTTDTNDEAP